MKKTNYVLMTVSCIPVVLYAVATLKTDSGFFYPSNKTHAQSSFTGFGEKNPAFGNRCHLANDYNDPTGTAVYAVGPGVVESASTTTPFYGSAEGATGGTIVIKHTTSDDTFFYALYGHIQNLSVAAGDTITSGQQIAEIGTFTAAGIPLPHVHFGINTLSANLEGFTPTSACTNMLNFVDPEPYLKANSPKLAPSESCTAVNDSFETTVNTIVTTASVLTNDTDSDGDMLSVSNVDSTSLNGVTITNNNDGTFTYTPPIDFTGIDMFNYTVSDANGCNDEGTVTITVEDTSTSDPEPTESDSDSGGGSTSFWELLLLSIALMRRSLKQSLS